MFRINAVCTGNICRSPMAEYLLRAELEKAGIEGIEVVSSAVTAWEVGNPVDDRARDLLTEHGIDAAEHVARQFTPADYDASDLILALDTDHYTHLRRGAPGPEAEAKVRMLRSFDPDVADRGPADQGIYDPWYGDEADFETTYVLINGALEGIVEFVRDESTSDDSHESQA
ncbi:low molecular weight protein-tyrosine-phosphatase [Zhihengliuella salsuginis]|uniref:protein-tyrosine-phosphatase n=1 Tax=Zhihengliuella salsuginis TaxID=578222 RepID=A0ABQ3GF92_9MICC|nr:low molecular weight protein-tyrosine-phosphatase [Zhihengliuella salsuginis]GHD02668.1 protein-tyrosine-phosphatase [Zhihengliuella salsuginis]